MVGRLLPQRTELTAPDSPTDPGLTGRQIDVLGLLMRGHSNKMICRALNLAESTVKNHVSAILKTLGVATRTEVVIRVGALGLKLPAEPSAATSEAAISIQPTLALPDKPSIVVLPLTNLTGDEVHDYFADGMVEDMTIALGRLPWLFVIASASAFTYKGRAVDVRQVGAELGVQYVLRGSIRKDRERIRATIELADANHGRQIWTERFECMLDDIFAMQDRVAIQVSAMIAPTLRSKEVERARRKPTENLSAYDLYLRAHPPHRDSLAQNQQSLALLYQAIDLDPGFAAAYGLAAWCLQVQTVFWEPPSSSLIDEALRLASLAAELGEGDPEALWMAGRTIAALSDRKDEGLALIGRSISLNPSGARAWWASGIARAYLGQRDSALDHLERSQRLNPLDIARHAHWTAVCIAHFFVGDFEAARSAADEAVGAWAHSPLALSLSAAANALCGREDRARDCGRRLLVLSPMASVSSVSAQIALQAGGSSYVEDLKRGLRDSGLPDSFP